MATVHLLVVLVGVSLAAGSYVTPDKCYIHHNHAAKYKLVHVKDYYPTQEINLILEKHPEMKSMFYSDELPLPPPVSAYQPAPQPVCPYHRYTLYSFFYAGKDCYVIYPDVQKVTYVQCNNDHNRDCQQCSGYGGVSKCEEDYDYRHVWAYCTQHPVVTKPVHKPPVVVPKPVHKTPVGVPGNTLINRPPVYVNDPVVVPRPVHQRPVVKPLVKPTLVQPVHPEPKPWHPTYQKVPIHSPRRVVRIGNGYVSPWNRLFRPYVLQTSNNRWKRSYQVEPEPVGEIERMKLYLPHHCGCKRFTC